MQGHKDLSIYAYISILEMHSPGTQGLLLTIPNYAQIYIRYKSSTELYLVVVFDPAIADPAEPELKLNIALGRFGFIRFALIDGMRSQFATPLGQTASVVRSK